MIVEPRSAPHPMPQRSLRSSQALVGLVLLVILIWFVAIVILQRSFLFDDAFITFRYAKNLAQGYGITWNRGEAPVEGYTPFLVVLALAPVLKLGASPLAFMKAVSVLSLLGIAALCGGLARRWLAADRWTAVLAGAGVLPLGHAMYLTALGMETLLFAFLLLACFVLAARLFDTASPRDLWLFGGTQLAALLVRPEAALFLACAVAVALLTSVPQRIGLVRSARILLASLVLPLALYLLWKQVHFGTLVPNPAFLKLEDAGLYSPLGLQGLLSFLRGQTELLVLVLVSLLLLGIRSRAQTLLAAGYVIAHALFFLRVTPLMNVHDRLLYPIVPFLYVLALPVVVAMLERVLASGWHVAVRGVALAGIVGVLLGAPFEDVPNVIRGLRGDDPFATSGNQTKLRLAKRLRAYPDIRNVSIAYGDAGIVPYVTEAINIDTVGLNDAYIARERDLDALADYVFSRKPTLFFYPANPNFSYVTYGHGPLGDFSAWARHPGFDDYVYVGTVFRVADVGYDLHVLVRRDDPRFEELSRFLRSSVVDTVLRRFPVVLGSR